MNKSNTKIIDISWPITPDMTSYKNSKPVTFTELKLFSRDQVRDSAIFMNTHTGTHVDAPSHFCETGKPIESVQLTTLVGPCKVFDMIQCSEKIMVQELEPLAIAQGDIILFKTQNSSLPVTALFDPFFMYLDVSGAQFLADKKIKAVGIDYLGIERNQSNHNTHTILFENNVTIIEGLRLGHVAPGAYFFCCLPLAVHGLEAAPARAILIENY